ncbi:hypothetical protein OfM1_04770 [Lactovum odontotermitis]
MYKKIISTCIQIQNLIEIEFPRQKDFNGIINNIYSIIDKIKIEAEQGVISVASRINWENKIRQFVDDTTHYDSPIIYQIEQLEKIVRGNDENSNSIKQ